MTEAEAKASNPEERVISACLIKHDGIFHELSFINGFWRCPVCGRRAFEEYLPAEVMSAPRICSATSQALSWERVDDTYYAWVHTGLQGKFQNYLHRHGWHTKRVEMAARVSKDVLISPWEMAKYFITERRKVRQISRELVKRLRKIDKVQLARSERCDD